MNLKEYKVLLLVFTSVSALFAASPALQRLLVYPQTDFFTEMWLLDPNHMTENFPFNITRNGKYSIFLGIGNHLGSCSYYSIQVKFRNQSQSAADSFNRKGSSLPPLHSISAFVADKEELEILISFSFNYVQDSHNETLSQVRFLYMTFNDSVLNLNDYAAVWDAEKSGFFGNLFFELWIYNGTVGVFQYHERFTGLWLNMTS